MKPRSSGVRWRDRGRGPTTLWRGVDFGRFFDIDSRAATFAAVFGAAVVLAIGLPLAEVLNIWIDEAFTLRTTGSGPIEAWHQAVGFEVQPPLYFVLESLWRLINEQSIFVARVPSVIFSGAAVAAMVAAAHRLMPRTPPLIVAIVIALNPTIIWAAVEMRVYPLVLLIAAALSWMFVESFLVEAPSRSAQVCYTFFAICGLFTQYYFGFFLLAHALTLLVVRRNALVPFAIMMSIAGAFFAPFVPIAMSHFEASASFVTRVSFFKAAHEIGNALFAFVLPHDINWSGSEKFGGFAIAAVLITSVIVLGKPAVKTRLARGFVMQWLMCIFIFTLLFFASGVPLDPLRHLIIIGPSSMLAAILMISLTVHYQRALASVALLVYICFAVGTLWVLYSPPTAKTGDWKRVAEFLSAQSPSVPVAVFPAELALPLHVYLMRPAIPIPKAMPFSVDYVSATTLNSEAEVSRELDPLLATHADLWLVTAAACGASSIHFYNYNCRYLEAYLRRRYTVARSYTFRGSLLRSYHRLARAAPVRSEK